MSGSGRRWRQRAQQFVVAAFVTLATVLTTTPGPARGLAPSLLISAPAAPSVKTQLLWAGDFEERSLTDWIIPESGGGRSGGEFNSAGGESTASTDVSRRGSRSAKLVLPGGSGGVRLFRWRELRVNRETFQSVWLYFPRSYTPLRNPVPWWNIMQFMSRSSSGVVEPFWHLDVQNTLSGGMRVDLVWWQLALEGPRRGEVGYRRFRQSSLEIPIARWFQLRVQLRQSAAFDGLIRVWQDGQLLHEVSGIRTSWRNCTYNVWCAANEWSVNNYSAGLFPAPAVIYADDARIERPILTADLVSTDSAS